MPGDKKKKRKLMKAGKMKRSKNIAGCSTMTGVKAKKCKAPKPPSKGMTFKRRKFPKRKKITPPPKRPSIPPSF